MKKIIVIPFFFLFMITPLYSDYDSYLASISGDLETEFATYMPDTIHFNFVKSEYSISEDFSNVDNFESVSGYLDEESRHLLFKNSFVVIDTPLKGENSKKMYSLYHAYKSERIPLFITTDSMLHTFHILFDYSLRVAELDYFTVYLKEITEIMLFETFKQLEGSIDPFVIESVQRNLAYFAVAMKLINPEYQIPGSAAELVNAELALIEAHAGKECSNIFGYFEDFSQYIPRGHYTRNEEFKRFFKSMMWYGRMMFRLQPEGSWMNCDDVTKYQETLRAILICQAILRGESESGVAAILWEKIYQPTVFFVGKSDDLSFNEYKGLIEVVFGADFLTLAPDEFYDNEKIDLFIEKAMEFKDPMISSSFVFETEDPAAVTKGFRFMGQRFIPDAYIQGQMVHTHVPMRMMPKALDIMAVLGSSRALHILDYQYRETVNSSYMPQIVKLRKEYSSLGDRDWVQNLYWNWLYSLFPTLTSKDAGFPLFMTNNAWCDKELNTALGSWTELRHDTILYAKQPYTPGSGQPDIKKGYVEPNPELYSRLASLSTFMQGGLEKRGLLNERFKEKIETFTSMQNKLCELSVKELTGEQLSEDDYEYIFCLNGTLDSIETFPTDNPYENGEDSQVALVVDVHTDPNSGMVIEEAIGNPDTMIVIAPVEDNLSVFAGPVFSYYEFTHPMADRLTDSAWQEMIQEGDNPPHSFWFESFHTGDILPRDFEDLPVIVNVSTNDTYLHNDNTLRVSLSLENRASNPSMDLYIALICSDNSLLFFPYWFSNPTPITLEAPKGTIIDDLEFLVLSLTQSFPKGSYLFCAGVCEEGTTNLLDKISSTGFLIR